MLSRLSVLVSFTAALSLTACATGSTMGLDRESAAPRANVHLDLAVDGSGQAVFPAVIEPRLPSVDRMSHHVRARLGEDAMASLRLCVAPDGHVTKVELLAGTSFTEFDEAVVRDAGAWRFAAMPGPANVQTCERATIRYLAPR